MSISSISYSPSTVVVPKAEGPICFIVPPHLTKKLGNEDHRAHDHLLRVARRHHVEEVERGFTTNYVPPEVISIYDCKHSTRLPGTLLATNKDYPKDIEAHEAFLGAKKTYDFYLNHLGRKSVDNKNFGLKSSVHYSRNYDNAFWDGKQMVYGDGDGQVFNRFTISVDVIGHELTHGVTQFTANWVYQDQPGALNESMSDCMGSAIKQESLKQTAAQADWLIGQGLLKPGYGAALRSMKAPGTAYDNADLGKDPQPARMSDYVKTEDDDGGVHINSGIPNHAFYTFATELDGYTYDKAAKVWYQSLLASKPKDQFVDFAKTTIAQTVALYKAGGAEEAAIRKAWKVTEVIL
jgi:Zn-dependent metalloprotease